MRPSSVRLLGLAFALACAVGLILYLSAPKPPDSRQIEEQMRRIQSAARARNVPGLMKVVAAEYKDNVLCNNVDQLHAVLIRGVRSVGSLSTDVSPGTIAVSGDTATSVIRVTGAGRSGGTFQGVVTVHWKKEPTHRLLVFPDTVWQVVSADYAAGLGLGDEE